MKPELVFVGLTAFATIKKAVESHSRFDWGLVSQKFPEKMKAFIAAVKVLGENKYYGHTQNENTVRFILSSKLLAGC